MPLAKPDRGIGRRVSLDDVLRLAQELYEEAPLQLEEETARLRVELKRARRPRR